MTTIEQVLSGERRWCVVQGDNSDVYSQLADKRIDHVITNPQFSLALEFVERALFELPGGPIAMLLPVPFLASETRFRFNTEHPCHVMVLPKRPSFTPDGKTDAVTYAWLVWNYGTKGTYEILDVWGDT